MTLNWIYALRPGRWKSKQRGIIRFKTKAKDNPNMKMEQQLYNRQKDKKPHLNFDGKNYPNCRFWLWVVSLIWISPSKMVKSVEIEPLVQNVDYRGINSIGKPKDMIWFWSYLLINWREKSVEISSSIQSGILMLFTELNSASVTRSRSSKTARFLPKIATSGGQIFDPNFYPPNYPPL